ncbi:hypothetical protein [Ectothiorhodospira mobilis]|uniref:hypothetical protein n=1 Tax=Ectothiorhodospira mobilis TaxID=195064 RepID=UPI0019059E12|nr:hypothetical protein [Ectothiorhodospira mobilis]MBK1691795.1 hypothetical protein [Ectothiorhodospira mobilis]
MQWTTRPLFAATLLGLGLYAAASTTQAEGFALGAKLGTTGLGLEGTLGLRDNLNLRGGFYGLDYSRELEEDGIEYDGDLELRSAALLADWHPFGGGFRVSAGGYYNGNEFGGSAEGSLDIGNDTYDARLDATVDWDGFAPYLGVGYGNAVGSGGWSFAFDLGVMFTGSPSVDLDGQVNNAALQAQFEDDLRREEAQLEDDVEDIKYYPVLSLGLAYRF